MASKERPSAITGGCLCGAVRYTISFPEGVSWPPQNGTCQCTMCRKCCGSIITQTTGVPTSNISPPLRSNPTYKIFKSSPSAYRGFCSTCGSSLTFNDEDKPEKTEIHVGTIDEEFLCGKRDEASSWEDEYGRHIGRVGGYGKEICNPSSHIYVENAIPDLSDVMPEPKFLTDRSEGRGFTCRLSDFVKR